MRDTVLGTMMEEAPGPGLADRALGPCRLRGAPRDSALTPGHGHSLRTHSHCAPMPCSPCVSPHLRAAPSAGGNRMKMSRPRISSLPRTRAPWPARASRLTDPTWPAADGGEELASSGEDGGARPMGRSRARGARVTRGSGRASGFVDDGAHAPQSCCRRLGLGEPPGRASGSCQAEGRLWKASPGGAERGRRSLCRGQEGPCCQLGGWGGHSTRDTAPQESTTGALPRLPRSPPHLHFFQLEVPRGQPGPRPRRREQSRAGLGKLEPPRGPRRGFAADMEGSLPPLTSPGAGGSARPGPKHVCM